MSIFFDLFSPGNRHRTEELRRLENTREEEAQGEPGRGPIDLNSGTVLIRVPSAQPQDSADDDAHNTATANADTANADTANDNAADDDTAERDTQNADAAASGQEDGGV